MPIKFADGEISAKLGGWEDADAREPPIAGAGLWGGTILNKQMSDREPFTIQENQKNTEQLITKVTLISSMHNATHSRLHDAEWCGSVWLENFKSTCSKTGDQRRSKLAKQACTKKYQHVDRKHYAKKGETNTTKRRSPVYRWCQKHALRMEWALPTIGYIMIKKWTETASQEVSAHSCRQRGKYDMK
jgi:hypothetical protein